MPAHLEVPSLKKLSIKAVGTLVDTFAPIVISRAKAYQEPCKMISVITKDMDRISKLLASHVPYHLFDLIAMEVLISVKTLIDKTKKTSYHHTSLTNFLTEMNIVISLTEVVISPYLKVIDFANWPKVMRYILFKNLHKLTGLEELKLVTGGWKTSDNDYDLPNGIRQMKYLKKVHICFDSCDNLIQVISENCPFLQCLDITSSRCVTDRSVPYLIACTNLKELLLHRTSVTPDGIAQILCGLKHLQDLGRCDNISKVMFYLYYSHRFSSPMALKKIECRDISTESLRWLIALFPNMEQLSVYKDKEYIDLTLLSSFTNLKVLKLLCSEFYVDSVTQLLELRGENLTKLHLEHVDEMNLSALITLSKFCPNIEDLVVYNCDFSGEGAQLPELTARPFLKLRTLHWVVDAAISSLEFILMNAVNIRSIHLGSSSGIRHLSVVKILNCNPLKRLEEFRALYSSDMSMRTVELLLASCTNLKVLTELESWQGVLRSDLEDFRKYLKNNNFDLDIRPTFSYS